MKIWSNITRNYDGSNSKINVEEESDGESDARGESTDEDSDSESGHEHGQKYATSPASTAQEMEETVAVGQFVMVDDEGSVFTGQITSLEKDSANVSVLVMCMGQGWIWPNQKDELLYFWSDIIQIIPEDNMKPINNRGFYCIFRYGGHLEKIKRLLC